MKGLPVDGTAAGGSGKDQGGTVAPVLQVVGRAETAGPAGSRGESGWFEPGWDLGVMAWVMRRKLRVTPCHDRCH